MKQLDPIRKRPRAPGVDPGRREFLQRSGVLAGLSLTAALGHLTSALGATAALDPAQYALIGAAARTLFPHAFVSHGLYLACAAQAAQQCADNPTLAESIRAGLAQLPQDFAHATPAAREAALQPLTSSPLFATVRTAAVRTIYRDPAVWAHFAYPGPSAPFGGYLEHGLNDIDWLPEA